MSASSGWMRTLTRSVCDGFSSVPSSGTAATTVPSMAWSSTRLLSEARIPRRSWSSTSVRTVMITYILVGS